MNSAWIVASFTVVIAAGVSIPAFVADFHDIASATGVTAPNVYGGLTNKDFILETTGNGVAILDFDGDGRNDVFLVNGTRFPNSGPTPDSRSTLLHNEGAGHFKDVSDGSGITQIGWGQGACVGDYDNDGRHDLLVTYFGHNVLYRNRGDARVEDATEKAKLPMTGTRYGSGCSFLDYDRDGYLDLFLANYVGLDLNTTPRPGK